MKLEIFDDFRFSYGPPNVEQPVRVLIAVDDPCITMKDAAVIAASWVYCNRFRI